MIDEAVDLWSKARCLARMLKDSRHWQNAYTEVDWLRSQEFFVVRLQLVYGALLEVDPHDQQAQRGLDLTERMLASVDEQRHLALARSIVRADADRDVD
ncbi:hypothetical protein DR64_3444 [Paraburkholderia xenovorans LB400]|uniref:Uncharacterized protein n=1 Tax=Paraburkholderia xenovorans (strain LB400) TaxID=266265 RepID=Q13W69_PARXL|nr:hypothetical protein [Paraburkholderia xenovorans]ABE31670.1 hypothetical protein Bxe_A1283 [Paraburkholderia xenovorans LB400]AIP29601.1 hypothetical protein DR64_3444 [Paraburkholderia xenovorans LB400]